MGALDVKKVVTDTRGGFSSFAIGCMGCFLFIPKLEKEFNFGFAIYWGILYEGKEQEEAIVKAKENLKYLEEELKGKKFFGGEKLGFVDIALGWLAHYVSVFEDVAEMKMVTEEVFPLLSAWAATFADVPIIKDNWPSRDKLIAKFQASRESHLLKMYQVD